MRWYKKWGIIHYPETWQAWAICIAFYTFLMTVFFLVDANSHSISDTIYEIFPYYVSAFLLSEWVATKTSR